MMTFLAPAWRCLEAVAVSRKMPVDSTTTSTPSSFQGRLAGSFSAVTRTSRPLTKMAPSLALTSAGRLPCTESCLSRCESVLASARSLTPTTSMSLSLRAVRKNTRPIRPKPLTPTRMLMEGLLVETRGVTGRIISNHARHAEDADGSRARPAQRPAALGGRGAGRPEHEMGQGTRERPPFLELERVERVAERPLVPCGRPRVVPDRRLGPARPTQAG